METLITHVMLAFEHQSMKRMILNNLKAHSLRNKLTSTIFSMALAFNIFIMVQFRLIML